MDNKVLKILERYPNLNTFLGESWINNKMFHSKHPLGMAFEKYRFERPEYFDDAISKLKDPNEAYYGQIYLDTYYWGNMTISYTSSLLEFIKEIKGFSILLKKLKNPDQFYDTLSEMEVISYFNKRFRTTVEPLIENNAIKKYPDMCVNIGGRDIIIEVFTPHSVSESEVATFGEFRAKNKLLDKIDWIKSMDLKIPLVLFLNSSQAEDIRKLEVLEAVYGQTQVTMYVKPNNGDVKIMDPHFTRANNSIYSTKSESNMLSAIVIYTAFSRFQGSVSFNKDIIISDDLQNIKNPLTKKEFEELNKFYVGEGFKHTLNDVL